MRNIKCALFAVIASLAAVAQDGYRCTYTPDVLARPCLSGVMSPGGDMTEGDFRTLAAWGVSLLRFQMVRDWHGVDGNQDLNEYDRWLEGRLDHFDTVVLPLACKYGMMVVLDLHVPPGGHDASLKPVIKFQEKYGARIYVGEFSAVAWAPGAGDYLRDCISVFNEHGWDWTYHAFREWAGWSVEHAGEDDASLRPSADNPRKRALLDGLKENLKGLRK